MTTPLQGANSARPLSDEKMDQVRELLFGEFEKQTQSRVEELEARVRELEVALYRRLEAMEARMEAMAGELDAAQRTTHQEIAVGMQDLAERMRRIGSS